MYTKEELVANFFDLFIIYGFKSVTVEDLAGRFNLSKKVVYEYFENKDDIIWQVVNYFITNHEKILQQSMQIGGDVLDKIINNHINSLKYICKIKSVFFVTLRKYYHKQYEAILNFGDDKYTKILKQLIIEGITSGIFRNDFPIDSLISIHMNHFALFLLEDRPTDSAPGLNKKELFAILLNDIRGMTTLKGHQLLDTKLERIHQVFND